jgi:hypothetical protein
MNAELLEADGQYRTTKKRKRLDLEGLTERDRFIEEKAEEQARAALRDAMERASKDMPEDTADTIDGDDNANMGAARHWLELSNLCA